MNELFDMVNNAVSGSFALAAPAAFIWGILSVLLSPCHIAGIPLIVGFIGGQEDDSPRKALILSSIFAVGILVSIVIIGLITSLSGRILGDIGSWVNYLMALVFILAGLIMLDVFSIPWSATPAIHKIERKGIVPAFLLGLFFGIALGPCTFAYMAPLLGIVFKSSTDSETAYGVILLTFYGLGHCGIIALAGVSTELVQKYLNWTEKSKGTMILKKVCGILVILAGLYMIYTAP